MNAAAKISTCKVHLDRLPGSLCNHLIVYNDPLHLRLNILKVDPTVSSMGKVN